MLNLLSLLLILKVRLMNTGHEVTILDRLDYLYGLGKKTEALVQISFQSKCVTKKESMFLQIHIFFV
jgi:hypothetical protein